MTISNDWLNDEANVEGPLARYKKAVAERLIETDSLQEEIVLKLDALAFSLAEYTPVGAQLNHRFLFRIDKSKPSPRGIYLYGDVGRGKSMLMDLFFRAAPIRLKRRVHFHAFMQEVQQRLEHFRGNDEVSDPLAMLANDIVNEAWLLCFDEFTVTDIADAMILGRLFEHFFAAGIVIFATSNDAPETLYKDGLNRERFLPFIALIQSRLDILTLNGPRDYRRGQLTGKPIYFTPLGAAADLAMDGLWEKLSAAGEYSATITILGRRLVVPRASGNVARFDFNDLCDAALGAADYLTVAARYRIVLIDRVPIMKTADEARAWRFMTMIDNFYEARLHLALSADAPPEELYPNGIGTAQFARTVSRLNEMQSARYLR